MALAALSFLCAAAAHGAERGVTAATGAPAAKAHDPNFDEEEALEARWSVSVEGGLDSADTRQVALGLDIPLERELLASFEAGRSFSAGDTGLIDTSSFAVGLTSAPGSDLEGGFRYDYFGNTDEIRTHELTPSVTVRTGDWDITGSAGLRMIVTRVHRPLIGDTISRTHLSYAVGGRLGFSGWGPLTLAAYGTRYLYSRGIREDRLERSARIGAISETAFTVVSGILDWNYGVSAGLEFDRWSIGLSAETSRTFVSKSDALSFRLDGSVMLSDSWSVEPQAGRYFPEGAFPSTYGALTVAYSW